MPIDRARQQIDDGIASVKAALGDNADALAPFFRIPGLLRAERVEDYLAEQGIQVWSADFLADDWRHVSSSRVYELAISRLEAKGKGILLLHDIQARTVAALPRILETMKARGYRIVHVVPATPERPATPTEPREWLLHPAPAAIAQWPEVPNFVFADLGSFPVPARSEFDEAEEAVMLRQASLARTSWPDSPEPATGDAAVSLAAPAASLFEVQGSLEVALRNAAHVSHRAQALASSARESSRPSRREQRRLANGRAVRPAHGGRHGRSIVATASKRRAPGTATAHRAPVKRLVQVRKRRV